MYKDITKWVVVCFHGAGVVSLAFGLTDMGIMFMSTAILISLDKDGIIITKK